MSTGKNNTKSKLEPFGAVTVFKNNSYEDARGTFTKIYENMSMQGLWGRRIEQINFSHSRKKGTVRGLHFQRPPFVETKMVSCVSGSVWDVVVDVRGGSETFLQWHSEILSDENKKSIVIPEGFAHGFQALTDDVKLIYLHDKQYSSVSEDGLNPLDPKLKLPWPMEISVISGRDAGFALIDNSFSGV